MTVEARPRVRSGLVIAAVAPHGGILIEELCEPGERELAGPTRAAMLEMGRRFAAAGPATVVVLTPHHVQLEQAVGVVIADAACGQLGGADRLVELRCPIDRELAMAVFTAIHRAGVPVLGVNPGPTGPNGASSLAPMDWGTLVPLWFLGGRRRSPPRTVIVSPGVGLAPAALARAGSAIAAAAAASGARVALVASADQGHAHRPDGPYGFDDAAPAYDERVAGLVARNRLDCLRLIDPALVERARADSWHQMLMLEGALGPGWRAELLSYEAPTYFGMLCAVWEPAG